MGGSRSPRATAPLHYNERARAVWSRLMTLVVGARLGPYEIVSPLGAGGMDI